jgi:Ulp1 family protease
MGSDTHSNFNDSPIEVEKQLHFPCNNGTMTAVDNKEQKLLVYPFIAGDLIETAADGLLLGEDPLTCSSTHLLQLQQEKAAQKNHFVTMLQENIDSLQPNKWLNDSVIDFWMLWITRKEPSKEN